MEANQKNISTILIEDDPVTGKIIQRHLEHHGISCRHFMRGGIGMDFLLRETFQPDTILLLDYQLPDMTAEEVIAGFSEHCIENPFVIITAHGSEQVAVRMMRLGAWDYLVKEENFTDFLVPTLEKVHDRFLTKTRLQETQKILAKKNQALEMISFCNRIVAQVRDQSSFLDQIAQTIVGFGHFPLVWIALKSQTEDRLENAAITGATKRFSRRLRLSDQKKSPPFYEPFVLVKQSGRGQIFQAPLIYGRRFFWHKKMKDASINTLLCLPLWDGNDIIGYLNLFSSSIHDFEREEFPLFQTLARDISLGLRRLRERQERHNLQKELVAKQRTLIEERNKAQQYLDVTNSIIVVLDTQQKVQLINRSGSRILGYDSHEIIGKNWFDNFVHEKERDQLKELFTSIIQTESQDAERHEVIDEGIINRILRKDGSIRHIKWSNALLKDDEGNTTGSISSGGDITDLINTQNELQEKEERLQLTLDSIYDGIWDYRIPQDQVYYSPRFFQLLYYSQEGGYESLSFWTRHIDKNDYHNFYQQLQSHLNGETELFEIEFRMHSQSTGQRWFKSRGKVVQRDEASHPVRMLGTIRDIHEQKIMTKNLAHLERRYELLLNSVGEGIVGLDREGQTVFINPMALKLVQREKKELIGQKFHDFARHTDVHGQSFTYDNCPVCHTSEDGRIRNKEEGIFYSKQGDAVYVRFSSYPILDDNQNVVGAVVTFQDISEEQKLRQQLLQAQKLEAIGLLAGGIAHDFNNMLTIIKGYSELVLSDLDSNSDYYPDIQEIQKAGERAAALTRQILAFSRRQPMNPAALNLNRLITDLLKMLQRLIGENIHIEPRLTPELPDIWADASQMEQVILNIAINARDAMPQGGRLVITTGQKSIRQNDNLDIEDDCAIYISLEDNGQGIPPESLEKIFDPFYSTKGVNQGTGLGLSVVYGIVRQHKGDIHVASQMGQGTRFDIYLPCSHDREAVRAQGQAINSEHLGSGERIALIEDDEAILDLAHKVLEQNQYIPLAFSRARDFWASWDEHAGDYDLLFSDIVLSDENIFTLLERVEERSPDIPIVLTSGYFSNDYLLNHIQDKGYSFIQKPFQPADLLKTIKNALNGKQSFA